MRNVTRIIAGASGVLILAACFAAELSPIVLVAAFAAGIAIGASAAASRPSQPDDVPYHNDYHRRINRMVVLRLDRRAAARRAAT